jgi:hypothetical protein
MGVFIIRKYVIAMSCLFLLSIVSLSNKALATGLNNQVVTYAQQYQGVPYVWGGTSPSGFDCSGLTWYVFSKVNVTLPRTSADQFAKGTSVAEKDLIPGDLVFFSTYKAGPSHVGIFTGGRNFIHASDSGVIISSLDQSYYHTSYIGAKRYISSQFDTQSLQKTNIKLINILKPINLWVKDSNGVIKFSRLLNPGEKYRVYGYSSAHGGQYNVGAGYFITNMSTYVSLQ